MALADSTIRAGSSLGHHIAAFGDTLWNALVALGEANSKAKQINYLSSLTDAQLAERGLRRQDIAQYVMGTSMYL